MNISIEEAAKIAHEVNRAYCQAIGDNSQPSWEETPEWQKDSAVAGAGFHLTNPDATPEQSHEAWLATKVEDGWKYGDVKDPEAKTHPCFKPYNELPESQRAKDYLFKAVMKTCLEPSVYTI